MTQPTPTPSLPVTKPTKAVFAAIGNTLGALQMFLGVITVASSDDAIDVSDVAPIVTGGLTLAVTVYAVWKTRNAVKTVARQRF